MCAAGAAVRPGATRGACGRRVVAQRRAGRSWRGGVRCPAAAAAAPGPQPPPRRSFLSLEEAGLVDMAEGLGMHQRFLARLTISSLNLLRVVAEQEGCGIEDLNAGRIMDWFTKDSRKTDSERVLDWSNEEFDLGGL